MNKLNDKQEKDRILFFVQYWNQTVLHTKDNPIPIRVSSFYNLNHEDMYLELTSLSDITDEHAIEVANKCLGLLSGHSYIKHKAFKNNILRIIITNPSYQPEEKEVCVEIRYLRLELTDYLRSQGYLLPFRGYTTQQLIDLGWVKLRTNN